MTWAVPLAGLVVVGVVGPLIAHLLSRRPPTPRPFPTLRFLTGTPTSARRLRTLHDPVLWAVRTLIVIVVAVAAAGPTLVTNRRQANWQAPILRATVVAPGMAVPSEDETSAGGDRRWTYTGRSLRAGIGAALRDLETHTDTPREILIRWDGRQRTLGPADLEAIPATIGVRLDVVDVPATNVPGDNGQSTDIEAAADDTAAREFVLNAVPWTASDGVRVVWPRAATRDAAERQATAPSAATSAVFMRMRLDPRLRDAAQRSRLDRSVAKAEDDRLPRDRFEPLARNADGDVLLWGAEFDDRPLLLLDARARDPLALWSVRVAADARRSIDGWPAPDTRWSDADLQAAQRSPAPTAPTRLPGGLDTRWWWLAALGLVLVEGVLRRARPLTGRPESENSEARDAA